MATASLGQQCDQLKSGSVADATSYIDHAGNDSRAAECAEVAFKQIAALPAQQAVPLLIQRLGYKRPKTESEQAGFYVHHPPGPQYFFPAIDALVTLGDAAEPGLLEFLAQNESASAVERDNALYALFLIKHGDVLHLLDDIAHQRAQTSDAAASARLSAAAKQSVKWCNPQIRSSCETKVNQ
jgi:hypothetical protein